MSTYCQQETYLYVRSSQIAKQQNKVFAYHRHQHQKSIDRSITFPSHTQTRMDSIGPFYNCFDGGLDQDKISKFCVNVWALGYLISHQTSRVWRSPFCILAAFLRFALSFYRLLNTLNWRYVRSNRNQTLFAANVVSFVILLPAAVIIGGRRVVNFFLQVAGPDMKCCCMFM